MACTIKSMSALLIGTILLSTPECVRADEEEVPGWISNGGWVLLIVGMLVSFWGLAVVCEDFFVPALNIMCDKLQIPDDVAGATFMAAGASSPEMFAAFISLFITHSTLGAGVLDNKVPLYTGTIIGSEIFNHLIICAAAVLYAKGGVLQLDWRLVLRESMFYLAALLLLFAALSMDSSNDKICKHDVHNWYRDENEEDVNGTKIKTDDPDEWDDPEYVDAYCIYWYQSLILLIGYMIYAIVCAYYQRIMAAFCPGESPESTRESLGQPSTLEGARASVANEPAVNFKAQRGSDTDRAMTQPNNLSPGELILAALAPSHLRGKFVNELEEVSGTPMEGTFGCYLFKRSRFFKYYATASNAWRLRWFEFDETNGMRSYHDRYKRNKMHSYDLATSYVEPVDPERLLFRLVTPSGSVYLQAPNSEILEHVIDVTDRITPIIEKKDTPEGTVSPMVQSDDGEDKERMTDLEDAQTMKEMKRRATEAVKDHEAMDDDEDHHSLIEWPEKGDFLSLALHVILLPLKALLYISVPDVRGGGVEADRKYKGCIGMCFVWLILLSYVMAACVEDLGNFFGIPTIVMGMTVSAAGTSFPNVFASIIVAKQGLGNMAVSNALGGNVFNIFMGLGLPWFLYSFFGTYREDAHRLMYFGMASGGVVFPVLVLIALLLGMLIVLISTGWKLYTIHAYIFIVGYVGFVIWVFTGTASPSALE